MRLALPGMKGVPDSQAVRSHHVRISAPQSAMETPRLTLNVKNMSNI